MPKEVKNITLLIGSCDTYSFLWENLKICLDKYWNINCKIILSTDKETDIRLDGIDIIADPDSKSWSTRIANAIKTSNADNIFFILDDYYLNQNITLEYLLYGNSLIDSGYNKVVYAPISKFYSLLNDESGLYKFTKDSQYLATVQPSLWKKEFLFDVLSSHNWSPWEFEIKGTKYISDIYLDPKILITGSPPIYFNVVRRGKKIVSEWDKFRVDNALKEFK